MEILYIVLLGLAVSLDALIAGATYGARKISIPCFSLLVVGGITAACTWLAMLLAECFGNLISIDAARIVGSCLLLGLGLFSLFQEYLLQQVTPYDPYCAQALTIRIGKILVSIMADPEAVDFDRSKSISPGEAVMLGFALGLDNIAATFGASLLGMLPMYTPFLMGFLQIVLIWAGSYTVSRLLPETLSKKFPYFPGALLILMGISRLVK